MRTFAAAKMTRQEVLDSIRRDYDETYFFTGIVTASPSLSDETDNHPQETNAVDLSFPHCLHSDHESSAHDPLGQTRMQTTSSASCIKLVLLLFGIVSGTACTDMSLTLPVSTFKR